MLIVQRRMVAASGYSAAAQDYINRVIAADVAAGNNSGLETATQNALAAFIDGLITDGLLGTSGGVISQASSVIKAACILAGARTLTGALVPLVGAAPTNNGFVSGDYNRKTGLVGNATNKNLNSNRNNNADPQNSNHLSVYASSVAVPTSSTYPIYIGAGIIDSGSTHFGVFALDGGSNAGTIFARNRSTNFFANLGSGTASGFIGMNRAASSGYQIRAGGSMVTVTDPSQTPLNTSVQVFSALSTNYSNARIAFYSIGEALTLSTLDARLATLFTALAAAIP